MIRRVFLSALTLAAFATIPVLHGTAKEDRAADRLARIKHIVVIFEENHSFDNLYGSWEGVNGIANAPDANRIQVNQDGVPFKCLGQNDPSLAALSPDCVDPTATGVASKSHFFNQPFTLDDFIQPTSLTCPDGKPGGAAGGCTKDLVHRFYQEQYQLNGGRQNRYVAGSDSIGLTMGTYATQQLPIYRYLHEPDHPHYAINDAFFQSAFGGSFLNHQWLIAAASPVWGNGGKDVDGTDLHSAVDGNGMPVNYPLYKATPGATVKDAQLTVSCNSATPRGVVCGDFAVNTSQPTYQPTTPAKAPRMPPVDNVTIGDRLNAAGIDWAWYSGGWSNANGDINGPGWTNGTGPLCADANANALAKFPNCPDKLFQFHHQPFNYFKSFAPGTAARTAHLRDEEEFLQLAQSSKRSCNLKPVSFIKPVGAENEHPGYASESNGSDHLVDLLKSIEESSCAKDTLVIVAYDENGGTWDHVSPPGLGGPDSAHDVWGPGTRIPSLIISPFLRGDFVVDHTAHDTTSILATIEHRFNLAPLATRDAQVRDLSSVYLAKSPYDTDDRDEDQRDR